MRFLKVLVNSLLIGIIFSFLLSILILDLNVKNNFNLPLFFHLSLYNFLIYGILTTILSIIGFYVYSFFSAREIKIKFISPNFLIIYISLLYLLFAEIFWSNYKYFRYIFPQDVSSLLIKQLIIILFVGIGGIFLYLLYTIYSHKRIFLIIYFILFFFSIPFLIISRSNFSYYITPSEVTYFKPPKITKSVIVVCMEGLSFDFLIPLISEEKLPNFEWLMDKGSWGALKSLTPCEPVIYYNSFITGKFPSKHSSLSLFNYNLFKLKNSFEILPRYIFMRQLQRFNFLKITPNFPVKRTKGIIDILKEYGCPIINSSWPEKEEQKLSGESLDLLSPFFEDIINDETSKGELIKETFLKDYFKEKKALETKNEVNPALFYLSLDGLKKIKLYFYKYSRPELFGNVPQEEIIKYGKIIEKYYSYYDQIIGRYLSSLKDNELLIIFSPHGIDPIPLWKRFLDWLLGVKEISAHYENAPEGVIFFYGNDVIKGKNIEGVRLIDIAPTILYYYGLPVGKDMDGVVIRSIFNDEFKSDNPVIYISSYDEISLK